VWNRLDAWEWIAGSSWSLQTTKFPCLILFLCLGNAGFPPSRHRLWIVTAHLIHAGVAALRRKRGCCARIVYLGCANLAGEDNRNVARMPRGLNASTD
jgi:hypothetical protein